MRKSYNVSKEQTGTIVLVAGGDNYKDYQDDPAVKNVPKRDIFKDYNVKGSTYKWPRRSLRHDNDFFTKNITTPTASTSTTGHAFKWPKRSVTADKFDGLFEDYFEGEISGSESTTRIWRSFNWPGQTNEHEEDVDTEESEVTTGISHGFNWPESLTENGRETSGIWQAFKWPKAHVEPKNKFTSTDSGLSESRVGIDSNSERTPSVWQGFSLDWPKVHFEHENEFRSTGFGLPESHVGIESSSNVTTPTALTSTTGHAFKWPKRSVTADKFDGLFEDDSEAEILGSESTTGIWRSFNWPGQKNEHEEDVGTEESEVTTGIWEGFHWPESLTESGRETTGIWQAFKWPKAHVEPKNKFTSTDSGLSESRVLIDSNSERTTPVWQGFSLDWPKVHFEHENEFTSTGFGLPGSHVEIESNSEESTTGIWQGFNWPGVHSEHENEFTSTGFGLPESHIEIESNSEESTTGIWQGFNWPGVHSEHENEFTITDKWYDFSLPGFESSSAEETTGIWQGFIWPESQLSTVASNVEIESNSEEITLQPFSWSDRRSEIEASNVGIESNSEEVTLQAFSWSDGHPESEASTVTSSSGIESNSEEFAFEDLRRTENLNNEGVIPNSIGSTGVWSGSYGTLGAETREKTTKSFLARILEHHDKLSDVKQFPNTKPHYNWKFFTDEKINSLGQHENGAKKNDDSTKTTHSVDYHQSEGHTENGLMIESHIKDTKVATTVISSTGTTKLGAYFESNVKTSIDNDEDSSRSAFLANLSKSKNRLSSPEEPTPTTPETFIDHSEAYHSTNFAEKESSYTKNGNKDQVSGNLTSTTGILGIKSLMVHAEHGEESTSKPGTEAEARHGQQEETKSSGTLTVSGIIEAFTSNPSASAGGFRTSQNHTETEPYVTTPSERTTFGFGQHRLEESTLEQILSISTGENNQHHENKSDSSLEQVTSNVDAASAENYKSLMFHSQGENQTQNIQPITELSSSVSHSEEIVMDKYSEVGKTTVFSHLDNSSGAEGNVATIESQSFHGEPESPGVTEIQNIETPKISIDNHEELPTENILRGDGFASLESTAQYESVASKYDLNLLNGDEDNSNDNDFKQSLSSLLTEVDEIMENLHKSESQFDENEDTLHADGSEHDINMIGDLSQNTNNKQNMNHGLTEVLESENYSHAPDDNSDKDEEDGFTTENPEDNLNSLLAEVTSNMQELTNIEQVTLDREELIQEEENDKASNNNKASNNDDDDTDIISTTLSDEEEHLNSLVVSMDDMMQELHSTEEQVTTEESTEMLYYSHGEVDNKNEDKEGDSNSLIDTSEEQSTENAILSELEDILQELNKIEEANTKPEEVVVTTSGYVHTVNRDEETDVIEVGHSSEAVLDSHLNVEHTTSAFLSGVDDIVKKLSSDQEEINTMSGFLPLSDSKGHDEGHDIIPSVLNSMENTNQGKTMTNNIEHTISANAEEHNGSTGKVSEDFHTESSGAELLATEVKYHIENNKAEVKEHHTESGNSEVEHDTRNAGGVAEVEHDTESGTGEEKYHTESHSSEAEEEHRAESENVEASSEHPTQGTTFQVAETDIERHTENVGGENNEHNTSDVEHHSENEKGENDNENTWAETKLHHTEGGIEAGDELYTESAGVVQGEHHTESGGADAEEHQMKSSNYANTTDNFLSDIDIIAQKLSSIIETEIITEPSILHDNVDENSNGHDIYTDSEVVESGVRTASVESQHHTERASAAVEGEKQTKPEKAKVTGSQIASRYGETEGFEVEGKPTSEVEHLTTSTQGEPHHSENEGTEGLYRKSTEASEANEEHHTESESVETEGQHTASTDIESVHQSERTSSKVETGQSTESGDVDGEHHIASTSAVVEGEKQTEHHTESTQGESHHNESEGTEGLHRTTTEASEANEGHHTESEYVETEEPHTASAVIESVHQSERTSFKVETGQSTESGDVDGEHHIASTSAVVEGEKQTEHHTESTQGESHHNESEGTEGLHRTTTEASEANEEHHTESESVETEGQHTASTDIESVHQSERTSSKVETGQSTESGDVDGEHHIASTSAVVEGEKQTEHHTESTQGESHHNESEGTEGLYRTTTEASEAHEEHHTESEYVETKEPHTASAVIESVYQSELTNSKVETEQSTESGDVDGEHHTASASAVVEGEKQTEHHTESTQGESHHNESEGTEGLHRTTTEASEANEGHHTESEYVETEEPHTASAVIESVNQSELTSSKVETEQSTESGDVDGEHHTASASAVVEGEKQTQHHTESTQGESHHNVSEGTEGLYRTTTEASEAHEEHHTESEYVETEEPHTASAVIESVYQSELTSSKVETEQSTESGDVDGEHHTASASAVVEGEKQTEHHTESTQGKSHHNESEGTEGLHRTTTEASEANEGHHTESEYVETEEPHTESAVIESVYQSELTSSKVETEQSTESGDVDGEHHTASTSAVVEGEKQTQHNTESTQGESHHNVSEGTERLYRTTTEASEAHEEHHTESEYVETEEPHTASAVIESVYQSELTSSKVETEQSTESGDVDGEHHTASASAMVEEEKQTEHHTESTLGESHHNESEGTEGLHRTTTEASEANEGHHTESEYVETEEPHTASAVIESGHQSELTSSKVETEQSTNSGDVDGEHHTATTSAVVEGEKQTDHHTESTQGESYHNESEGTEGLYRTTTEASEAHEEHPTESEYVETDEPHTASAVIERVHHSEVTSSKVETEQSTESEDVDGEHHTASAVVEGENQTEHHTESTQGESQHNENEGTEGLYRKSTEASEANEEHHTESESVETEEPHTASRDLESVHQSERTSSKVETEQSTESEDVDEEQHTASAVVEGKKQTEHHTESTQGESHHNESAGTEGLYRTTTEASVANEEHHTESEYVETEEPHTASAVIESVHQSERTSFKVENEQSTGSEDVDEEHHTASASAVVEGEKLTEHHIESTHGESHHNENEGTEGLYRTTTEASEGNEEHHIGSEYVETEEPHTASADIESVHQSELTSSKVETEQTTESGDVDGEHHTESEGAEAEEYQLKSSLHVDTTNGFLSEIDDIAQKLSSVDAEINTVSLLQDISENSNENDIYNEPNKEHHVVFEHTTEKPNKNIESTEANVEHHTVHAEHQQHHTERNKLTESDLRSTNVYPKSKKKLEKRSTNSPPKKTESQTEQINVSQEENDNEFVDFPNHKGSTLCHLCEEAEEEQAEPIEDDAVVPSFPSNHETSTLCELCVEAEEESPDEAYSEKSHGEVTKFQHSLTKKPGHERHNNKKLSTHQFVDVTFNTEQAEPIEDDAVVPSFPSNHDTSTVCQLCEETEEESPGEAYSETSHGEITKFQQRLTKKPGHERHGNKKLLTQQFVDVTLNTEPLHHKKTTKRSKSTKKNEETTTLESWHSSSDYGKGFEEEQTHELFLATFSEQGSTKATTVALNFKHATKSQHTSSQEQKIEKVNEQYTKYAESKFNAKTTEIPQHSFENESEGGEKEEQSNNENEENKENKDGEQHEETQIEHEEILHQQEEHNTENVNTEAKKPHTKGKGVENIEEIKEHGPASASPETQKENGTEKSNTEHKATHHHEEQNEDNAESGTAKVEEHKKNKGMEHFKYDEQTEHNTESEVYGNKEHHTGSADEHEGITNYQEEEEEQKETSTGTMVEHNRIEGKEESTNGESHDNGHGHGNHVTSHEEEQGQPTTESETFGTEHNTKHGGTEAEKQLKENEDTEHEENKIDENQEDGNVKHEKTTHLETENKGLTGGLGTEAEDRNTVGEGSAENIEHHEDQIEHKEITNHHEEEQREHSTESNEEQDRTDEQEEENKNGERRKEGHMEHEEQVSRHEEGHNTESWSNKAEHNTYNADNEEQNRTGEQEKENKHGEHHKGHIEHEEQVSRHEEGHNAENEEQNKTDEQEEENKNGEHHKGHIEHKEQVSHHEGHNTESWTSKAEHNSYNAENEEQNKTDEQEEQNKNGEHHKEGYIEHEEQVSHEEGHNTESWTNKAEHNTYNAENEEQIKTNEQEENKNRKHHKEGQIEHEEQAPRHEEGHNTESWTNKAEHNTYNAENEEQNKTDEQEEENKNGEHHKEGHIEHEEKLSRHEEGHNTESWINNAEHTTDNAGNEAISEPRNESAGAEEQSTDSGSATPKKHKGKENEDKQAEYHKAQIELTEIVNHYEEEQKEHGTEVGATEEEHAENEGTKTEKQNGKEGKSNFHGNEKEVLKEHTTEINEEQNTQTKEKTIGEHHQKNHEHKEHITDKQEQNTSEAELNTKNGGVEEHTNSDASEQKGTKVVEHYKGDETEKHKEHNTENEPTEAEGRSTGSVGVKTGEHHTKIEGGEIVQNTKSGSGETKEEHIGKEGITNYHEEQGQRKYTTGRNREESTTEVYHTEISEAEGKEYQMKSSKHEDTTNDFVSEFDDIVQKLNSIIEQQIITVPSTLHDENGINTEPEGKYNAEHKSTAGEIIEATEANEHYAKNKSVEPGERIASVGDEHHTESASAKAEGEHYIENGGTEVEGSHTETRSVENEDYHTESGVTRSEENLHTEINEVEAEEKHLATSESEHHTESVQEEHHIEKGDGNYLTERQRVEAEQEQYTKNTRFGTERHPTDSGVEAEAEHSTQSVEGVVEGEQYTEIEGAKGGKHHMKDSNQEVSTNDFLSEIADIQRKLNSVIDKEINNEFYTESETVESEERTENVEGEHHTESAEREHHTVKEGAEVETSHTETSRGVENKEHLTESSAPESEGKSHSKLEGFEAEEKHLTASEGEHQTESVQGEHRDTENAEGELQTNIEDTEANEEHHTDSKIFETEEPHTASAEIESVHHTEHTTSMVEAVIHAESEGVEEEHHTESAAQHKSENEKGEENYHTESQSVKAKQEQHTKTSWVETKLLHTESEVEATGTEHHTENAGGVVEGEHHTESGGAEGENHQTKNSYNEENTIDFLSEIADIAQKLSSLIDEETNTKSSQLHDIFENDNNTDVNIELEGTYQTVYEGTEREHNTLIEATKVTQHYTESEAVEPGGRTTNIDGEHHIENASVIAKAEHHTENEGAEVEGARTETGGEHLTESSVAVSEGRPYSKIEGVESEAKHLTASEGKLQTESVQGGVHTESQSVEAEQGHHAESSWAETKLQHTESGVKAGDEHYTENAGSVGESEHHTESGGAEAEEHQIESANHEDTTNYFLMEMAALEQELSSVIEEEINTVLSVLDTFKNINETEGNYQTEYGDTTEQHNTNKEATKATRHYKGNEAVEPTTSVEGEHHTESVQGEHHNNKNGDTEREHQTNIEGGEANEEHHIESEYAVTNVPHTESVHRTESGRAEVEEQQITSSMYENTTDDFLADIDVIAQKLSSLIEKELNTVPWILPEDNYRTECEGTSGEYNTNIEDDIEITSAIAEEEHHTEHEGDYQTNIKGTEANKGYHTKSIGVETEKHNTGSSSELAQRTEITAGSQAEEHHGESESAETEEHTESQSAETKEHTEAKNKYVEEHSKIPELYSITETSEPSVSTENTSGSQGLSVEQVQSETPGVEFEGSNTPVVDFELKLTQGEDTSFELPSSEVSETSTRGRSTNRVNFTNAFKFSTTMLLLMSSVYGHGSTAAASTTPKPRPSVYVDLPIFMPNTTESSSTKCTETTKREVDNEQCIVVYVNGPASLNGTKWNGHLENFDVDAEIKSYSQNSRNPESETQTTTTTTTTPMHNTEGGFGSSTLSDDHQSSADNEKLDMPKFLLFNKCGRTDFAEKNDCVCAVDDLVSSIKHKEFGEGADAKLECSTFLKLPNGIIIGNDSLAQIRKKRSFLFGKTCVPFKRETIDYSKGFFDDIFKIVNTEFDIYALPGTEVIIPCLNKNEVIEFNKYMQYSWLFDDSVHIPDSHIKQDEGNLLIERVSANDSGNYTCTIKSKISDEHSNPEQNYHHQLVVVSTPIYKIKTRVIYTLNQSCTLKDGDMMNTYLPKIFTGMLCGFREKLCTVEILRPNCITGPTEHLLNVTFVVTMRTLSNIIPTVDNTKCKINCQMHLYAKLAGVLVNNIEVIEKQPITSELKTKSLKLYPKKVEPHNKGKKGYWSAPPMLIITCPAGYGVEKAHPRVCVVCPKNTYSGGEESYCKMCQAGRYQPTPGSKSCLRCSSPLENAACLRALYSSTEYFKLYVGLAFGCLILTIIVLFYLGYKKPPEENASTSKGANYVFRHGLRKTVNEEEGEPLLGDESNTPPPQVPPPDF